MKKQYPSFAIAILLLATITVKAQTLLPEVRATYDACLSLQAAIGSGSTTELRAAGKLLKECNPKDLRSLRYIGEDVPSLDEHFVFDYEFVDSLIENRAVFHYAQRYAERSAVRGTSSTSGAVYTKTCLVRGSSSVKFSLTSRGHQEFAFVTEPGGMITVRIHDKTHDTWHNDTEEVTNGKPSRLFVFDLPTDRRSSLEVEVINRSDNDVSFVVISN